MSTRRSLRAACSAKRGSILMVTLPICSSIDCSHLRRVSGVTSVGIG